MTYLVTVRRQDGVIQTFHYGSIRSAQKDALKSGANIQAVQPVIQSCGAARGLDL